MLEVLVSNHTELCQEHTHDLDIACNKTYRLTNIHFLLKNSIKKRCLNVHLKDCEILMSSICQEQAYSFDSSNRSKQIDIVTETDDVLPSSVENDDDDLSNDLLLGEADLFLSDNLIPPGIENFADDPEGVIRFLEELLIDDSILSD
nr:hypothetical protein [Tanacetum cinerariifolium]